MTVRPTTHAIAASRSARGTEFDRTNFPYSHYLLDWLALRIASFVIGAGVRANTVTAANFVLLLVALAAVLGGAISASWFLLAGVLLHGVMILDNVDGHVARYTQQTSKWGALADSLLTWFQNATLPLCVGLALAGATQEWWERALSVEVAAWTWFTVATLRSVGYLLTVVITERAKLLLGVGDYSERIQSVRALVVVKGLVEAEALALVLASLVGVVGLVHLGYAALHLLILCIVLLANAADLRRADLERSES